ncbi:CPBP family intramembrane glutamic endopeptidase [Alloprevotella tannerae]|uniref:CPBP family intramembrane glutamic endopeptidase n=1 Tax=Alloprevotella tannerae TaxID=76122 RepID=UPI00288A2989|nr:type II CAAX endopeptidase family protein [Alloprevotella tannerae]
MQTSKTMQIGLLIVALIMPYAFQAFFGAVFLFIGVLPDLLQGKPFDPHAIEHMPTMLGLALICSNLSLYFFYRLTQLSRHPLTDAKRKLSPALTTTALLSFLCISFSAAFILMRFDLNDGGIEAVFNEMKTNPAGILAIVVFGPLGEELAFREVFQRRLQAMTSPLVAIIVSGVVFGLYHLNFAQMIPAIGSGIVLGILYYRFGDIRICLAAHILNNGLSTVISILDPTNKSEKVLLDAYPEVWGALLLIIGVLLLKYWLRKTPPAIQTV